MDGGYFVFPYVHNLLQRAIHAVMASSHMSERCKKVFCLNSTSLSQHRTKLLKNVAGIHFPF
jgi:hypothetical protein